MKSVYIIGLVLIFSFFVPSFCIGECIVTKSEPKLWKKWQTEDVLRVPESIIYHAPEKTIYVSNINGKASEKNNLGFISKLSLKGEVINLDWASGLNAPKGMAIYGKFLYVADIDHLVEIALSNGRITAKFQAPGAKFLNDVAADSTGRIYISDSSSTNSAIYQLKEGKLEILFRGPEIKKPNGLYMEGERLLVGNSGDGCIKAIDVNSLSITTIAYVGTGIDGLQSDGKGNYFVSDWKGRTTFVSASGERIILMDTTVAEINSADLNYIQSKKLLIIPTFYDNRVIAYKMKYCKRYCWSCFK